MTNAVSLAQQASTGVSPGFRNRIINGAMVIDQRNAGAEVNPAGNNTYCIDRWMTNSNVASKFKVQQNAGSVTPPTGFTYYLGATSLSAYSVGSSDSFALVQKIEGYNFADLDFGKATAKTVTISFWVRSSLTGTFGGSLTNGAIDRSYPFTYTISSANTWEQKSVTITGDTSGTWLTTNGIGAWLWFGLGMGSTLSGTAGAWAGAEYRSATGATSVVGTNGATWYVTGCQLEIGSTATSFDYRPYGTELALCQRYYQKVAGGQVTWTTNTSAYSSYVPIVTLRSAPTYSVVGSPYVWQQAGANVPITSVAVYSGATEYAVPMQITTSATTGVTNGYSGFIYPNNSSSNWIALSSEL